MWWNNHTLVINGEIKNHWSSHFLISKSRIDLLELNLLCLVTSAVPDSSVSPSASQGESAGWLTQRWICPFAFDHCSFNRHHMGSHACLTFNNLEKNGSCYVMRESVLDWQVGIKRGGGRSIRVCEHIFLWANFCSSDILCPIAMFYFLFFNLWFLLLLTYPINCFLFVLCY